MRLLVVSLLALAVGQTSAALPQFSWDTVPVFFHSSNESGPYSQESISVIAKHQMVTVEKWQSYDIKTIDDEDAMVEFMKAVKAANPKVATYFYMNSWKDRPEMTRMARQFSEHPDWALRDVDGNPVKNTQGYYVFDQSQAEVQQWWQNICLNATKYANGDGCYCDCSQHTQEYFKGVSPDKLKAWGQGLLNLTRDVQAALGSDRLLIGKEADQPYVNSAQIEFFKANNDSINELIEGAKNGKVMQAHVPIEVSCRGDLTDYLSAFLVAAGKYSYYGCGNWTTSGNDTTALFWHPEYDKPLGAPLALATYEGGQWKRQFASGTVAIFDTATNKGVINWGNQL